MRLNSHVWVGLVGFSLQNFSCKCKIKGRKWDNYLPSYVSSLSSPPYYVTHTRVIEQIDENDNTIQEFPPTFRAALKPLR